MIKIKSKVLEKAIVAVRDNLTMENSNIDVDKVFNGYVSSLGAAIRCSGLAAAVLSYNGSSTDKPKVISAIGQILGIQNNNLVFDDIKIERINQVEFEEALIALKLAIRTFNLK